jgi:dCMP deaminase
VGAVLVSRDNFVIATGFNGPPKGVLDLDERFVRPAKYLWTAHAEENAIASAARRGASTDGAKAIVTHFPCSRCARSLIQAGIKCVVVGSGTTSMPDEEFTVARAMFAEAGVEVIA